MGTIVMVRRWFGDTLILTARNGCSGNDDVAEGRLFLAFLSLILNNDLEQRLLRTGLLKKMTIAQFLATLRKIKAVTTEQGTRHLLDVTKKCADLLEAGGFPPPPR